MAGVQNEKVMVQIRSMLKSLQESDPQQCKIILFLLQEVYKEFNTGVPGNIDRKLYDMIDNETFFSTKTKS